MLHSGPNLVNISGSYPGTPPYLINPSVQEPYLLNIGQFWKVHFFPGLLFLGLLKTLVMVI